MQDDSDEEYVNEDLGPPPKESSVKQEAQSTDEDDEEGYVNDDLGPPEKVDVNVE